MQFNLAVFSFLFFFAQGIVAQVQSSIYQPLSTKAPNEPEIIKWNEGTISELTGRSNPTYKKDMEKDWKDMAKGLDEELKKGYFFFDTLINPFAQTIFNNILKANPALDAAHLRLFVSREPEFNAVTYPNGVIKFFIPLIKGLENESQIAAVMCHEIAHYIKSHGFNRISKYHESINSKELQEQLKNISKQEFGKYAELKKLMEKVVFSSSRHTRTGETEADSVGLALLMNTKYNPYAFLRVMDILDSVDITTDTSEVPIKEILERNKCTFNTDWMYDDNTYMKMKSLTEFEKDSLKTHPDCKVRKVQLSGQMGSVASKPESVQPYDKFTAVKNAIEYEEIESSFFTKNIDYCIYQSARLLQKKPNDGFAKIKIAESLNFMYDSLKGHHLFKYLSRPDSHHPLYYRHFLTFLNNLTLKDINKLNLDFLYGAKADCAQSEEYWKELYKAAAISQSVETMVSVKTEYKQLFPNGKYLNIFQ